MTSDNGKFFLTVGALLLLSSSCTKVSTSIHPQITTKPRQELLVNKPSPFTPLTAQEKKEDWGKEMLIAKAFSKEFDLYRAISTFKRAKILLPQEEKERLLEIEYEILLCYFYAKRYGELIECFEEGSLPNVDRSFPAFQDLLTMLYQSYGEMCDKEKQDKILEILEKTSPSTSEKLSLYSALNKADLPKIRLIANEFPSPNYLDDLLKEYERKKKSISGAKMLNALLPGAGYLYLGQKKSAFTALVLNGLFIAATYEFFHKGYTAAALITLSFEMGWYLGGIEGAAEQARFYNERMYEQIATPVMQQHELFPILMLHYSF